MQSIIKNYAERAFGKKQAGSRPGRSTIDKLFTMRHTREKCIYKEHNQKAFINFLDFKQAFYSIWHEGRRSDARMQEH